MKTVTISTCLSVMFAFMTISCSQKTKVDTQPLPGRGDKSCDLNAVAGLTTGLLSMQSKNCIVSYVKMVEGNGTWWCVCYPDLNRVSEVQELLACRPRFRSLGDLEIWIRNIHTSCPILTDDSKNFPEFGVPGDDAIDVDKLPLSLAPYDVGLGSLVN